MDGFLGDAGILRNKNEKALRHTQNSKAVETMDGGNGNTSNMPDHEEDLVMEEADDILLDDVQHVATSSHGHRSSNTTKTNSNGTTTASSSNGGSSTNENNSSSTETPPRAPTTGRPGLRGRRERHQLNQQHSKSSKQSMHLTLSDIMGGNRVALGGEKSTRSARTMGDAIDIMSSVGGGPASSVSGSNSVAGTGERTLIRAESKRAILRKIKVDRKERQKDVLSSLSQFLSVTDDVDTEEADEDDSIISQEEGEADLNDPAMVALEATAAQLQSQPSSAHEESHAKERQPKSKRHSSATSSDDRSLRSKGHSVRRRRPRNNDDDNKSIASEQQSARPARRKSLRRRSAAVTPKASDASSSAIANGTPHSINTSASNNNNSSRRGSRRLGRISLKEAVGVSSSVANNNNNNNNDDSTVTSSISKVRDEKDQSERRGRRTSRRSVPSEEDIDVSKARANARHRSRTRKASSASNTTASSNDGDSVNPNGSRPPPRNRNRSRTRKANASSSGHSTANAPDEGSRPPRARREQKGVTNDGGPKSKADESRSRRNATPNTTTTTNSGRSGGVNGGNSRRGAAAADSDDRSVGSRKSVGRRKKTSKSSNKSEEPKTPKGESATIKVVKKPKETNQLSDHIQSASKQEEGEDASEGSSRLSHDQKSSCSQLPLLQFDPTNADFITAIYHTSSNDGDDKKKSSKNAHDHNVVVDTITNLDGTKSQFQVRALAGLPTFEDMSQFHDSASGGSLDLATAMLSSNSDHAKSSSASALQRRTSPKSRKPHSFSIKKKMEIDSTLRSNSGHNRRQHQSSGEQSEEAAKATRQKQQPTRKLRATKSAMLTGATIGSNTSGTTSGTNARPKPPSSSTSFFRRRNENSGIDFNESKSFFTRFGKNKKDDANNDPTDEENNNKSMFGLKASSPKTHQALNDDDDHSM